MLAAKLAAGPVQVHGVTKRMLNAEAHLDLAAAIEAEAVGAGRVHADGGLPRDRPPLREGVTVRPFTDERHDELRERVARARA